MKAIFIAYNQAVIEIVEFMLYILNIRGFTQWEGVQGRGSVDGDPHYGNHTWPEINCATICIVDDSQVQVI